MRRSRKDRTWAKALRQIRLNLYWHGGGGMVQTSNTPERYAVEVYTVPPGSGRRGLRSRSRADRDWINAHVTSHKEASS